MLIKRRTAPRDAVGRFSRQLGHMPVGKPPAGGMPSRRPSRFPAESTPRSSPSGRPSDKRPTSRGRGSHGYTPNPADRHPGTTASSPLPAPQTTKGRAPQSDARKPSVSSPSLLSAPTPEYYCQFDSVQNEGQIIKRADIIKNSFTRPPLLYNKKGDKKVVMAYDPARSTDNSILTVAEFREDPHKVGWRISSTVSVSLTWG